MMSDRLTLILPSLISPNQVGFVQGRAAVSNIRKVGAVLDKVKLRLDKQPSPAILTSNGEKAFVGVS